MGINDISNFNLVCKNTDLFIKLEERLYKEYPHYKDCETYFEVEGRRIKRFKILDENKIKTKAVINLFTNDDLNN